MAYLVLPGSRSAYVHGRADEVGAMATNEMREAFAGFLNVMFGITLEQIVAVVDDGAYRRRG